MSDMGASLSFAATPTQNATKNGKTSTAVTGSVPSVDEPPTKLLRNENKENEDRAFMKKESVSAEWRAS